MHVITDDFNTIYNFNSAVALGTFDGIHLGHREIIRLAKEYSNSRPVIVYAFENIPAVYFGSSDKAILTNDEKIDVLSNLNIDYLVNVKFDEKIVDMAPTVFLDHLKNNFGATVISCGFNYTFGKNAKGNPYLLSSYCNANSIKAAVAQPVLYDSEPVSSSRIRKLLQNGNIELVNDMLSYNYFIKGNVIKGKRLGNTIGYPTANITFSSDKLVPKKGVYSTVTKINGVSYPSMTNIGVRPTVENTGISNAETYIIGFDNNIYGENIRVEFLKYMREEVCFSSISDLKKQLNYDREIALQTYFSMIK